MGHRDLPCAVHSPYADALHDSLHSSLQTSMHRSLHAQGCTEPPDISTQQAAEEIAAVFAWTRTEAFGHDREHLIEAFRNRILEASDKEIEYLALASILPERYGRLIGWGSEWSMGMREYAQKIADGKVRI